MVDVARLVDAGHVRVMGRGAGCIELHEDEKGEVDAEEDERDEHTDELETSGEELLAVPSSSSSSVSGVAKCARWAHVNGDRCRLLLTFASICEALSSV